MKYLVTICLTLLTVTHSRGQTSFKQSVFRPFSIVIIKPDNANISDSLRVYADSIENEQFGMYRATIESLEEFKEVVLEKDKKEIDEQIQKTKERERQDRDFKYFHTIAIKSLSELNFLFNSNEKETDYTLNNPVLTGQVVGSSQLFTSNLKKLGKRYKLDYIVSFENIHTDGEKGAPTLRYEVVLFWTKKNTVIFRKEIEGNASVDNYKLLGQILPPGNIHENGVHCDNYLECMITSAVRFSTEALFKQIEARQKK